jgi:hypothetical protein
MGDRNMSAIVKCYVEFDDGSVRWVHEIKVTDDVRFLNSVEGYACRVTGPDHNPYWLKTDGAVSKRGPA